MDWKSLTSKLDPYIQKMDPYIEKAKDAGYKALDFTQKQLQNTPIVLKTLDEYNLLRTSKRFVLIAYDETDILSREVILRSPVWSTYAWSDAAEIRFLEISSAPDIVKNLGIVGPVDMHVWYLGAETAHLTTVEDIQAWWKNRNYDGSITPVTKKSESSTKNGEPAPDIIDPLAGR